MNGKIGFWDVRVEPSPEPVRLARAQMVQVDDYNGIECRCGETRWIPRDLSEWACDRCGIVADRDEDGRWRVREESVPEVAPPRRFLPEW